MNSLAKCSRCLFSTFCSRSTVKAHSAEFPVAAAGPGQGPGAVQRRRPVPRVVLIGSVHWVVAGEMAPPVVETDRDEYTGEFSGDKRQGEGRCSFANGDVYEGSWYADVREGYGKLAYANGDTYEGGWHEDMRTGQGRQDYATGSWYVGSWLFDVENGLGRGFLQVPQRGVYEGEFKDGFPHGVGKFVYDNGDVYEGGFECGVRCGIGRCVTAVGAVFEGAWRDDVREGEGTEAWPNGDHYDGAWSNGARTGVGEMRYGTGDTFVGEWEANTRKNGCLTYVTGDQYTGEFVEDMRIGIGTCRFANGDEYEGEWLNDLQDGEGICTYADGAVYTGTWIKGMRDGEGELQLGDYDEEYLARSIYRGGWKKDKYSGLGSLTAANGDRYDGVWVNGQRQGRGTQRYVKAGERYQGIWMRDTRHGRGKHYYNDGTLYDGQWRNDMRDGKGMCKYVDPKRIGVMGTYTGLWSRNLKHGKGEFAFDNGDHYVGMWKNDVRCGRGKCKYHTGENYDGEWVDDVRKGSGNETMPRKKLGDDWGMKSFDGTLTMSLRILPEIQRPRAPAGNTTSVRPQDKIEPNVIKQADSELPKLTGMIVDPKGVGVGGVSMKVQPTLHSNDRDIVVADNGSFRLAGLPEGGIKVSLTLEKAGYASLQTTLNLMSKRKFENSITLLLAPLTMVEVFDSNVGVELSDARKNTVKIPADALCYTDGTQYEGKCEISALAIDASAAHSFSRVPGFEGVNLDTRRCLVNSFGAMYVHLRAVPGGEEIEIRGGQKMVLSFKSKVPRTPTTPPSAWRLNKQGGYWSQTDASVSADGNVLAAPKHGLGFEVAAVYDEGPTNTSTVKNWKNDVSEILGSGPTVVTTDVEVPAAPAVDTEGDVDEEPVAEDDEAGATAAPTVKTKTAVVWQGARFEGPGEVGQKAYLYKAEQAALKTEGDVAGAVASLTKPGTSSRPSEVRMVQHLVLQEDGCAYASLTVPELVEAIEEHGDAADAAKRLCQNPTVLNRSREEELKEAVAQAVPFAPVSGAQVKSALSAAKDDLAGAAAAIVEATADQEPAYKELQMVLSVLGVWKSNVDIGAALDEHGFAVFEAAAALTGIEGLSATTWGKGQSRLVDTFKRAHLKSMLADMLKFVDVDERAVEAALNLTNGDVELAVDGLVREWRGQQLILELQAQLKKAEATAWVDIPAAQVKAALMENGSRDAGLKFLTDLWVPRRQLYDDVFFALEATGTTVSDAEICAAMEEAEFDIVQVLRVLKLPQSAVESGKLLRIMEGLMERYDFLPVSEDTMKDKLVAAEGDVAAALEALFAELGDQSVDDDQTWWMASYRSKRRSSGQGNGPTPWTSTMLVSHTGWWNCAAPVPAGLVTGKLVDSNMPRAGSYIVPTGESYAGWSPVGRVAEDGTFAVVAPWESSIKLTVRDTDANLDGITETVLTNFSGGVSDLGNIELSTVARPEVAAAPRFGGKRKIKDDVRQAREAMAAKTKQLTQTVRAALTSVGKWESDTVIADELGKRGWSVERVAVALTHDQDILSKQLLSDIRKEIVAEFGTVPLTDGGIQCAVDACNGSKAEAVAALRNGVVRAAEEQLRRTRTVLLREQVEAAWKLVGDVLRDGNEKLFARELTLEAAAALRDEHLAKGRDLSALRVSEYSLFRQLQECSAVLASEWSSAETVNGKLLCGGIATMVGLYNRQAAVYCSSDRYDVAAALLRKADFITSQPSLMPAAWEERLKLRAVTLNNIGAMYRRRGQNGLSMNSFDQAMALWQAVDLSSGPKWPLFLPTEHPLSLYLNSASLLLIQGQPLAAKARAGAAVQAMLEKCLSPSPGLDARAAELSKEADKALAELSAWEDDHADTDVARYTQRMEDEHLKVEDRAKEAVRKKLIGAEDARKECWRKYDVNADATPDFTRVLATAHYLFAAAAAALAEEAAQAALEASAAVTDVSAPDASSTRSVVSARSGAGSQKSASASEDSVEREPGKPWPKRTIVFPEPPSDSELASLHQSRAVKLCKRALGDGHPIVELMADALDAETASEVAGVMYLQV